MKILFKITIFIICMASYVRCTKEEVTGREYPRLITLGVSDISKDGAKFNADITFRGNFEVLTYGFVWAESANPTLTNTDKVVFSENILSNQFSAEIETTLQQGTLYHVRSFITTKDYIVYGNDVEFLSLGSNYPDIISFSPSTGSWGDTLIIHGKHFSYVTGKNIVTLGEVTSQVVEASDTTLTIVVPEEKNEASVKVNVSIAGNTGKSKEDFHYLIPEITAIEPIKGTFKDTITINGTHFGRLKAFNLVRFGDFEADIISYDSASIKVVVPEELNTQQSIIQLFSVGYELEYSQPFKLKPPVITLFEPDTVRKPGELIRIYGHYFNPIPLNNTVQIDGYDAEVIDVSGGILQVYLPDESILNYNISVFKDVDLSVTVAEQSTEATEKVKIFWQSTWTRKKDFPGLSRYDAVAFSTNNKGYFGTGFRENNSVVLSDFWEYDPTTDEWTQIADFPGHPRGGAVAFTIYNTGFVGLGYYPNESVTDVTLPQDFYKFYPESGTWHRISDFPGGGRSWAASFSINHEGYVGTGWWGYHAPYGYYSVANDLWKYNLSFDSWIELDKFPNHTDDAVGFAIGDEGYMYDYNKLYHLENGQWVSKNSYGVEWRDCIAFSIGQHGYVGLGDNNHGKSSWLGEYDPGTQTWEDKNMEVEYPPRASAVFVIGSKAYVISGKGKGLIQEVWEFDPTKPE